MSQTVWVTVTIAAEKELEKFTGRSLCTAAQLVLALDGRETWGLSLTAVPFLHWLFSPPAFGRPNQVPKAKTSRATRELESITILWQKLILNWQICFENSCP